MSLFVPIQKKISSEYLNWLLSELQEKHLRSLHLDKNTSVRQDSFLFIVYCGIAFLTYIVHCYQTIRLFNAI